jgi:TPR repeat protein
MADDAPRHPSYDPDIERNEEDLTSRLVAPYQVARRSVPLFLSDRDGVPDPSEFLPQLAKMPASYYISRILAGALGGIAIAGLAALASSDSARDFMASAKASSVAALSVASVAMQPAPAPTKVPDIPGKEPAQPLQAAADNQLPVSESDAGGVAASGTIAVAALTPTRDDIKAAYQSAAQGSAPPAAALPESAAPADPILHHLDASEIASLLKRADALIGSGDLAAARLVLRRAAEAGDARAAMMLGGTYDPTVLEKLGVRGVVPDSAVARGWYEKAKRLGATEATPQLDLFAKKQS